MRRWLGSIVLAALATAPAPAQALLTSTVDVYFGTTGSVQPLTQALFVMNDTPFTLTLTGLYVIGGSAPKDFAVAASSTCLDGTVLDPDERCRIDLEFRPTATGARDSTLKIFTDIDLVPTLATLTGTGVKIATPKDPYPALVADPPFVEFGARAAGGVTAYARVMFRNLGTAAVRVDSFTLVGRAPNDFAIGTETCIGKKIEMEVSCYIDVRFLPQSDGTRTVSLRVRLTDGERSIVTLIGTGGTKVVGGRVEVIEFYNVAFDHHFVSSLQPDIVANDTGANAGWTRTGRTFPAFPGASAGASPVCRYYIPPQLGNSHFYSASPAECAEVGTKFKALTLEAPDVMYAYLPDAISGACPANSIAVYRVWNQRADSNHRYTTDFAVRDAMVASGYVAEGYGEDGVAMCAPI